MNILRDNYLNTLCSDKILTMNDDELVEMINKTTCINTRSILRKKQYNETVLLALHGIADSWEILATQHKLTPYFCFKYLYDCPLDSKDDWISYDEVVSYLQEEFTEIKEEEIRNEFNRAMEDRKKERLYGDYDIEDEN